VYERRGGEPFFVHEGVVGDRSEVLRASRDLTSCMMGWSIDATMGGVRLIMRRNVELTCGGFRTVRSHDSSPRFSS